MRQLSAAFQIGREFGRAEAEVMLPRPSIMIATHRQRAMQNTASRPDVIIRWHQVRPDFPELVATDAANFDAAVSTMTVRDVVIWRLREGRSLRGSGKAGLHHRQRGEGLLSRYIGTECVKIDTGSARAAQVRTMMGATAGWLLFAASRWEEAAGVMFGLRRPDSVLSDTERKLCHIFGFDARYVRKQLGQ
ncbi:hypothetical protein NKI78_24115 [Mesorhizobium sp. M0400]|uniref:hypothetical protein n=1 Tax=Mesorhizobium sp. M0400 TaxID=2956941 RepID=UPI00333630D1